jgi:outer membrane protein assembly factor BamD (BamD/ComL family)
MTVEARTTLSSRKKANSSAPTASDSGNHAGRHSTPQPDAAVLHHYQTALQLLQQAKFEKALVAFEKLVGTASAPLAERCRMYVTACHRELAKSKLEFATPEEQYDYAVSLLNTDYYEEAREQFNAILKGHPGADFAFYGLAVLDAITGQVEECLDHLTRAIEGNPRNRLQARTDTDFHSMQDDPRFTELLYPEAL